MRIFSIFFHPERKTVWLGGAEKRFLEFLKFVDRGDFGVEVLVFEPKPSFLNFRLKRTRVFSVERPWRVRSQSLLLDYLSWIIWDFKALVYSIPVFFREKPDLILSPNNTLPNLLSAFLAKLLFRKPLCVVVHHFDFVYEKEISEDFSLTGFFRRYRKIGYSFSIATLKALASFLTVSFLKRAERIISVSKFSAKIPKIIGIRKEHVLVSGNGVNFFRISRFCRNFSRKKFDGAFVGRISLEKGIYDLIDAWRIIVSKRRNARLAVVGEGPELENLKFKVQELGLERNVKVFGGVPDREMYKILCESKIFIFPSRFEGWGLAVAEALACGLPVVCYKIPALKEVFGGCKSVFFVSEFSSEVLAEKILQILENFNAKKFREISRRFVRGFGWEKFFMKELRFLQQFLKENG